MTPTVSCCSSGLITPAIWRRCRSRREPRSQGSCELGCPDRRRPACRHWRRWRGGGRTNSRAIRSSPDLSWMRPWVSAANSVLLPTAFWSMAISTTRTSWPATANRGWSSTRMCSLVTASSDSLPCCGDGLDESSPRRILDTLIDAEGLDAAKAQAWTFVDAVAKWVSEPQGRWAPDCARIAHDLQPDGSFLA